MAIIYIYLFYLGNTTSVFEETHFQFLWLIYFAYVIIFLASLFGNSVIIHIIRTDNSMKNSTNYLILNQACSDLLITMAQLMNLLVPFYHLASRWFGGLLGLITCKCFLGSMVILPVFSIWMLVTIAVDRFYAVTRPLRLSPIAQHLKKIIVSLWAWSIASSTNVLVNGTALTIEGHYYCYIADAWITFHFILGTGVNVALPLLIIIVLYTIVCHKLWSRDVPAEGANQNHGQAAARKVTRMMVVIVVLYVLCWLPLDIILFLEFLGYVEINVSIYFFLVWLTVAFSGINPYIYLTLSQKFRHRFKDLFGNCLRNIRIHNVLSFRSQSVELEQI